jgi:broad specificity phosphatase PhoE
VRTSWIFLRHGQSHANAEGWLSGWDDVGLTPLGEAQARAAGELLRDTPLARCLVSDLGRAHRTALLALEGRGVPVHVLPELRERHMGVLQREPWEAVRDDGRHARWLAPWEAGPPGGESHREVVARVLAGLRRWEDGRPTLVVAHGSLLRGVLAVLRREPLAGRLALANATPEAWEGSLPWPPPRPPEP